MSDDYIYFDKTFWKPYPKEPNYLVGEDGRIYSKYARRIMKPNRARDGHERIDIHGKHVPVSHIVWDTWSNEECFENLSEGYCIRHINDIPYDNRVNNLMCGTQKENIADSYRNGHKDISANTWVLTVLDKEKNKVLTFCPASDFIRYSGHSCLNGGVNRMFTRDWFKKRFEIIEYRRYFNGMM
ncbi:MAG: HNH endonuclease [Lachnospiraceae bacterium]|nr:HNH endonuclease [Lachnospiraceae bacterium]